MYFPRAHKSEFAKATTTELFKYEGREEKKAYNIIIQITQTSKHNFHTHNSQLIGRLSSLKHEQKYEQFLCHTQLRCIETTMDVGTPTTGLHQSVYEQK